VTTLIDHISVLATVMLGLIALSLLVYAAGWLLPLTGVRF
jgi:hypothetical protein